MEHNGGGDGELLPAHGPIHSRSRPRRRKPRSRQGPFNEITNGLDLISRLPDECLVEIFRFLPSDRDRCSCASVSKKWLLFQANMRSSDFKSSFTASQERNHTTSKSLMCEEANDIRLAAIAVGMGCRGGLTDLKIGGANSGLTDFGLRIIAQASPRLKSLLLGNCRMVGSKGLASIGHGCNGLKDLHMVNLPSVDDEGLIAIARSCPNLWFLTLESLPLIGNQSLQAFAKYSSNLNSISLKNCGRFSDEGVISILISLPNLVTINLVSLRVRDGVLEAIARHGRSIKSLSLVKLPGINDMGFHFIGGMEKLESLSLKSCAGVNDTTFNATGNGFSGLKQIVVSNSKALSDKGLKELLDSAALLQNLQLENCNRVTSNGLMEIFMNCHERLKVLILVNCNGIKETDLSSCRREIPKFPFLRTLTICKCVGVGDSFLSWLGSACLQVNYLSLTGLNSITDYGVMAFLKGLNSHTNGLVRVDLSGCIRLTDWSIYAITSGFGGMLRSLRLDCCLGLTDKSLQMIAEFCHCLHDLDISRCRITDNGLQFIEMMCGSLEALNIQLCPNLSKNGIDSVRETFWWCDMLLC